MKMRANKIICFAVGAGAVVAVGGFGDNQRRIDIDATLVARVVANLLSGSLDVAFSNTIDFPQGQALEQASWGGKIEYWPGLPRYIEYQGRDWGNTSSAATVRRSKAE